jgi:hypothetical protein
MPLIEACRHLVQRWRVASEDLARQAESMTLRAPISWRSRIMAWYRTRTETEEGAPSGGGIGLFLALIVIVVVVALVVSGSLYLRQTDSTTEIILDKNKIEQGVDRATEKGKEVLHKAGEELQDLGSDKPGEKSAAP